MKTTLSSIALATLTALSAPAFAGSFTGKFSVDASHCDGLFRSTERAYISLKHGRDGIDSLLIQAYGDEATSEEVLLGEGSRQAPGTSVDAHGVVTETWETRVRGGTLRSVEQVVRPSRNLVVRTVKTLTLDRDTLDIEVSETVNGKDEESSFCRLIRD